MNAECRMMNDEFEETNGECRMPAIHHSSLILHPSHRGLTLLEVLVSMGVLSLGLLGVAALIPIGKMAMTETNKADRTGMCGRAGLRDCKVRRMLDTSTWNPQPAAASTVVAIDPLGYSTTLNGTQVGGTDSAIARISLNGVNADDVFRWQDDLNFVAARDSTSPTNGERPMPGGGGYIGDFSWFFTVAASPSEVQAGIPWYQATPRLQRRQFTVSIVVCWKRLFTAATDDANAGERTVSVVCDSATGYGGIGISYPSMTTTTPIIPTPMPKEKEWVLLTSTANGQASWYRVVAAGSDGAATPTTHVSLVGPDWNGGDGTAPTNPVKLIVIKGVTGVYTRTVQLDNDAVWSR